MGDTHAHTQHSKAMESPGKQDLSSGREVKWRWLEGVTVVAVVGMVSVAGVVGLVGVVGVVAVVGLAGVVVVGVVVLVSTG